MLYLKLIGVFTSSTSSKGHTQSASNPYLVNLLKSKLPVHLHSFLSHLAVELPHLSLSSQVLPSTPLKIGEPSHLMIPFPDLFYSHELSFLVHLHSFPHSAFFPAFTRCSDVYPPRLFHCPVSMSKHVICQMLPVCLLHNSSSSLCYV